MNVLFGKLFACCALPIVAFGIPAFGVPAQAIAQPSSTTTETTERLPNIVLILADDLGYGDLSCYNSESKVTTSQLDLLASRGVRFTDAHSPCTVCTPTRYSLLTGQMAFRIPRGGRVFSGVGGPSLIQKERLTLPEMLSSKGYETACFGKWHIGITAFDSDNQPIHKSGLEAVQRIDYSRPIEGGPIDAGFQHFYGTACCPTTDWLYAYIDGKQIPVPPTIQLDKSHLPKHPYANDCRRGMVAENFDLEEVDNVFLEKSKAFIENHVATKPDQPFFLFHSTQAVHLPSFAGKQFQGATAAGPHGDFIHQLDVIVGDLVKTIEQAGITDDTLIIFTSDNGPEVPTVYHMRKDFQHDGASPWRGVKRDNWEGGHRVPFLAVWPDKIPAGSISNEMTSLTDVFATIASLIDYPLDNDVAEDSFDLSPALLKPSQPGETPIRDYLLMQGFRGTNSIAIRQGDWKLLNHLGSGGNNYQQHPLLKEWHQPDLENATVQLYDLKSDPQESKNLCFEEPEITAKLQTLLQQSLDSGRSTPKR